VEMKPKNLEFAKMVFAMALSEGNNLGTAWYPVLSCISQVMHGLHSAVNA
jgi:hypothetical protein